MAKDSYEEMVKPGMEVEFETEKWKWIENPHDPTTRNRLHVVSTYQFQITVWSRADTHSSAP